METSGKLIRINKNDNVAVALCPLQKGESVSFEGASVCVIDDIPAGHKIALENIEAGGRIIKYGLPVGAASERIEKAHTRTPAMSKPCFRKRANTVTRRFRSPQLPRVPKRFPKSACIAALTAG